MENLRPVDHPNGSGRGPGKHIILDWPVREGDRLREKECDFWDGFFLDSIVGSRATRPWRGKREGYGLHPRLTLEPWMNDSR